MKRLALSQAESWHRVHDGNGGPSVYDETRCAYCGGAVRPDAVRLCTARTNDGEWWLVEVGADLSAGEWRDFQAQLDGGRAPTLLPIGPDCLRQHPEFDFAVAGLTLDDLSVMGSVNSRKYTREVSERRRGRRSLP